MGSTKSVTILAILAGALSALGAWTQEWFSFSVSEGASVSLVSVPGTAAAPLVSSVTMGLLAGVAVILIGQHVMRLAVAIISIVLSALGIGSIVGALSNSVAASKSELSRVTGVADVDALAHQIGTGVATAWPLLCLSGLALSLVGAVLALGFSVNWKSSGSRYTRPTETRSSFGPMNSRITPAELHDGDSWDSLSKGTDPTR